MNLIDATTVTVGHPFRGSIKEVPDTGYRAVQMKNVTPEQGVDWSSVAETEVSGRRTDWLCDGDILFAARGSRNYAALVENCPEQVVAAPHFFVIRVKPGEPLLPEYLVWFLNQAPTSRYFRREAEGTRTLSIRRSVLENTPIAVPPLGKQQQIVGLHATLRREQQIAKQLVRNGETMMDAIAIDLLNRHS
ncbi:MAG: restriction endonuclease subunit S [Pseudomonadota bacterium]